VHISDYHNSNDPVLNLHTIIIN